MKSFSLRRLTINTFQSGFGRMLAQILNVLLLPLALIYITSKDFGLYSLLQIASLILGVFMSFGLHAAYIASFNDQTKDSSNLLGRIFSQQMVFGGALYLFFFIIAPSIMNILGMDSSLPLLLVLLAGEYFANLVLIASRWQIIENQHWQMGFVAFCKSVSQVLLLFIFVIWYRYGLLGLVIADFGSKLCAFAIVCILAKENWKFEFKKTDIESVYKLGLPAMPDQIFFWLLIFLPLYFLKQNNLLAVAGAFSLAWRLMSPVELLGNSLASAAAGKLLDRKTSHQELNHWYVLSVAVIFLSTLAILFFSPDIFKMFFSSEYYPIVYVLPLIAAGVMFLAYYYFEWISVSGSGKTYGLSISSGSGVLVLLVSIWLKNGKVSDFDVALLFAFSFFTTWIVARWINKDLKLGHWLYLVASASITIAFGFVVVNFTPSVSTIILKLLSLALISVLLIVIGFFLYFRDIKADETELNYLSIPNYAEIAKKINPSSRVLDIGSSEGFFLGDLETNALKVGIDTDFERLREGKKERSHVDFVCAEASRLPFRSNSFETVLLIGVLPYVENPDIVLREAYHVLGNFGQVEISTANSYWMNRYVNIYNWKYRVRYYTPKELEKILNEAGFVVKAIYTRGRIIAPLLGNLFVIPNIIDKLQGHNDSVIGPSARWLRNIINPIIQWEYNHHRGDGYQNFASGIRNE